MSNKRGKLFVFSAPSGAGKTTIVKDVLKSYPDLVFSVSATTRQRREIEVDGRDYFFITEEEFKSKIDNKEFIEWEKFYDYYYGTLRSFVEEKIEKGISVVLELDVKGAVRFKKSYPEAVMIFIAPPSLDALKERLIKRNTETDEDLKKRIERAEMEIGYRDQFDYAVVNENLETAKSEVKKIVQIIINQEL